MLPFDTQWLLKQSLIFMLLFHLAIIVLEYKIYINKIIDTLSVCLPVISVIRGRKELEPPVKDNGSPY